jgi:hypothetical protein
MFDHDQPRFLFVFRVAADMQARAKNEFAKVMQMFF